ncbi:MAG: hypothetical protein ABIJ74_03265 [archaeon]
MKKAQISLDLMLTVIVAILLAQVFGTFTQELISSERSTGVKAQEENIGNTLIELINQSKMLDENRDSNFSVRFKIPYIFDPEKRGGQDCNITIKRTNPTKIIISYASGGMNTVTIEKDLNFNFRNTTDLNYLCGRTVDANRDSWGERI